MSLYESTINLAETLRSNEQTVEFSAPPSRPYDPATKMERFAISGYVLGETIDSLIKVDPSKSGEGIRFRPELDSDVVDVGTLAAWTVELFTDSISERYRSDPDFRRNIDRLAELSDDLNEDAHTVQGVRRSTEIDAVTLATSGLQVDNFARDIDGLNRRLHYVSGFYDIEPPKAENAKDHLRLALADGIEMAKQSIVVQDFFDALEDLSLLMDNGEIPRRDGFREAARLTNSYWSFVHREDIVDGVNTKVPGKTPKALYKVSSQRGLIRVSPIIDKIEKHTDPEVEEERVGCAGMLLNSVTTGHSALQVGLRATLHALEDIGYYEHPVSEFRGISPLKTAPFEYGGKQYFMGSGFTSTLKVLEMSGNLPK